DYSWEFGDDSQGQGQNVSHVYDKPGGYIVDLTISDNAKVANSSAADQLIVAVNDRPTAAIDSDLRENHNVSVDETVTFNGKPSADTDGSIIAYEWDFGDGEKSSGLEVTHEYKRPGRYDVIMQIRDNSTSTTDTHTDTTLVIVNDPPIADAAKDQLVTTSEVQFDGSASRDNDGSLTAYDWDFGDGYHGRGPTPVHVYQSPGTYKVRLTVTDDSKTSTEDDFAEITIIVNHSPLADAGDDRIGVP
ncbi:MAG: PKD domain-containing protein, partial [Planctomycetes bacterium]|nr:PKD domain-containing protein [Planctomycetota bacterium]